MELQYSVVIRTIGKAGEKYQKLLRSIDRLAPAPEEVIVVLPEGYEKPAEQLGYERFCFSPKGMVKQRMYGVAQCRTPYALICDDDVEFEKDFAEKLYSAMQDPACGFSAGPLLSFLPKKGFKSFVTALSGGAVPTLFHRDRYCTVLRTTGYSYNRKIDTAAHRFYESQSLPWTCFFADVEKLRSIRFEEETWLDLHGYSALDDQCMFYKAWLKGIKTVVVSDALYIHNDAMTSRKGRRKEVFYSMQFNRYVFWKRFLYDTQPNGLLKAWSALCFGYYRAVGFLLLLIELLRGRAGTERFKARRQALREAKRFVKQQLAQGHRSDLA